METESSIVVAQSIANRSQCHVQHTTPTKLSRFQSCLCDLLFRRKLNIRFIASHGTVEKQTTTSHSSIQLYLQLLQLQQRSILRQTRIRFVFCGYCRRQYTVGNGDTFLLAVFRRFNAPIMFTFLTSNTVVSSWFCVS